MSRSTIVIALAAIAASSASQPGAAQTATPSVAPVVVAPARQLHRRL